MDLVIRKYKFKNTWRYALEEVMEDLAIDAKQLKARLDYLVLICH